MDYKSIAEEALAKYDSLLEERNALAGTEVTDEVRAEVEVLDANIDATLAEVRTAQEKAAKAVEAEELRAKVSSLYVAKPSVKTATFSDELRNTAMNGGGYFDIKEGPVHANGAQYRAAPIKGSGGNFTNGDFVTAVMTGFAEQTCVFRAGARVITTTSGEPINAPVVANIAGAKTAEGVALPETADNTSKTLSAYKYGAIALVARELVEDTSVDLSGLVADVVADQVAGVVNAAFLIGDGTGDPQGIFVGGTTIAAANAASVVEADLYKLYYGVKDSARAKGAWFMSPTTAATVRALSSTNWSVHPGTDNPDQLFGRPVFTDTNIAAIGTGNESIAFGDPKGYTVRQVRGLRVEVSNDYKFGNDDVAIKVVWRGDGIVTDANAIRVLSHP